MKGLIFILLIFLAACSRDPISKSTTNNPQIVVEFLFEHEGCRVYRFADDGVHYFTNCTETISRKSQSCGKNCVRYYDESINGSKPTDQNAKGEE